MTICIPKRPFEIISDILFICGIFSWIPLFIFGLYLFNSETYIFAPLLFIIGLFPFAFTIVLLKSMNNAYHWIKWCNSTQQKIQESKK